MYRMTSILEATHTRDFYKFEPAPREYDYLAEHAGVWEATTRQVLDRLRIEKGDNVLDVGCGWGRTMQLLAKRVAPGGSVTGLDADGAKGVHALNSVRHHDLEVCRVVEASIQQIEEIPGAPFDFVLARLLLFHMPNPVTVLQKMWQWVRPGGTLLIMDYDTTGTRSLPQHPVVERTLRLINDGFRRGGLDIEIGSRMPVLFENAGIGAPDGCEIAGLTLPIEESTGVLCTSLASLRPRLLEARLIEADALEKLERELLLIEAGRGYLRWPDMVSTWKRKTMTGGMY